MLHSRSVSSSGRDLARIFGVSCAAVTYWLKGLKLGEDLKDAKPISGDLAVLMVPWIESGQEPTPEELTALLSRSTHPARQQDKGAGLLRCLI
jgi:hypothetical protein